MAIFGGSLGYCLLHLIKHPDRFKSLGGSNVEERRASLEEMFGSASWRDVIERTA